MTTQHTPGPWAITPRSAPKGTLMIESKDGLIACMESGRTRPVTYAAAEANARLIASAPSLLKALIDLIDYTNSPCSRDRASDINQAIAAIAAATGGTP